LNVIGRLFNSTIGWLSIAVAGASSALKTRATLEIENFALRHQLDVLQRSAKTRPHFLVNGTGFCGSGSFASGLTGVRCR
jgi:hypothetical protein